MSLSESIHQATWPRSFPGTSREVAQHHTTGRRGSALSSTPWPETMEANGSPTPAELASFHEPYWFASNPELQPKKHPGSRGQRLSSHIRSINVNQIMSLGAPSVSWISRTPIPVLHHRQLGRRTTQGPSRVLLG